MPLKLDGCQYEDNRLTSDMIVWRFTCPKTFFEAAAICLRPPAKDASLEGVSTNRASKGPSIPATI